MRLLLDECVPARLSKALPSHQVSTVGLEGWSGIKNGKLLALAATKFDAFVTVDKNLSYQQNTSSLPAAVLVLDALSNELPYLLPLIPALDAALKNLKVGSYVLLRSWCRVSACAIEVCLSAPG
jgi:predicted nuclease of predicted toxin-antitoxin system